MPTVCKIHKYKCRNTEQDWKLGGYLLPWDPLRNIRRAEETNLRDPINTENNKLHELKECSVLKSIVIY